MERRVLGWCIRRMKIVALVVCLGAFAASPALAKGRISVLLGDSTPRAGHAFPVVVRTDYVVPANDWLRLIAVAPGRGWYEVVRTVTRDSSLTHANIGFELKLVRVGPRTWRAVVRLPRTGRWRLVVPNGTHFGFMVPPPAAWMPWVQVHG